MNFLTLNVRHGGGDRIHALVASLAAQASDVLVLTEFRAGRRGDAIRAALADRGWRHQFDSNPPAHGNGVLLASREPLAGARVLDAPRPWQHRAVEAQVGGVHVVAVYFPLGRPKLPFWDYILEMAATRVGARVLLIGDFNTGKHRIDEAGATFIGPEYVDRLESQGWVDAWRHFHPESREYTWFSSKGNGFRVDYAFASPALLPSVRAVRHDHGPRERRETDHSALLVELA